MERVLTDLEGLSNLTYVGGDLEIADNGELPTCEAELFKDKLVDFRGEITICQNLPDACGSDPCQ